MANMSYCRFENTFKALKDCIVSLKYDTDLKDLSKIEKHHALYLRGLCKKYLEITKSEEEEEND